MKKSELFLLQKPVSYFSENCLNRTSRCQTFCLELSTHENKFIKPNFFKSFFRKIQIDGHSSLPKSYAVKVFEFLAWFSQSRFYSWSENDSFSSFFHTNKFLYHYRISFPFRIPSFDSSFQVANRIIVHLVASFVCY